MGNCVRKQSTTEWGGDDWGSFGSGSQVSDEKLYGKPLDEKKGLLEVSAPAAGTEVKIRLSRNQLEELLTRAERKGLSAQEILSQLINGDDQFEPHQRSWRPALQSIPE